jgi:hypothetical protein
VFNSVYRFILSADRRCFSIWRSVRRELWTVIGLSPLLFSQLDCPWFDRVLCSDASEFGLGVVAAPASSDQMNSIASLPKVPSFLNRINTPPVTNTGGQIREVSYDAHAQSLFKSQAPTFLDRAITPPVDGTGGQIRKVIHSTDTQCLSQDDFPIDTSSFRWSTIVSSRWSKEEHINVLELRALSTAIRWALSRPIGTQCRILCLSDSQVVVFAVSKGRSSSFQILRRLRYLTSLVLAAGLRLIMRWIPTTANPADQPSRNEF